MAAIPNVIAASRCAYSQEPWLTYVVCEAEANMHIFVTEQLSFQKILGIARNYSRLIKQAVNVYHDTVRKKYRLVPMPTGMSVVPNTSSYGLFIQRCDEIKDDSKDFEDKREVKKSGAETERIPRPRNKWILYRQVRSRQILEANPGITAGEISTVVSRQWKAESEEVKAHYQELANGEDRKHKEMYPDYKYQTKKD